MEALLGGKQAVRPRSPSWRLLPNLGVASLGKSAVRGRPFSYENHLLDLIPPVSFAKYDGAEERGAFLMAMPKGARPR